MTTTDQGGHGAPVMVVSFRGPVAHAPGITSGEPEPVAAGGLVTGLLGQPGLDTLGSWVCAAISDADREAARAAGDGPFPVTVRDRELILRMVELDPEQQRLTSTVMANPLLWFVHHELGDLAVEPTFGPDEHRAFAAYAAVNACVADAVVGELDRLGPDTVVLLQDYHLYLVAPAVRERRPSALLQHFVHVPWPGPDVWRQLPQDMCEALVRGLLANDVIGFHTPRYVAAFLATCEQLLGLPVDLEAGRVDVDERPVLVRAYPLSPQPDALRAVAASEEAQAERLALRARRPELLVLRVERADPSKNLLRGFQAWELMLETHPELHGRASMLALVTPSRGEIARYRDYLEQVQDAAAHANSRFGTDTWEPIMLDVGEGQERAAAAFQEYDVLFVNPVRDGMNLVAKEGVLLNERDGVLVLSDRAGAYEQLGPYVLGVHPLDISQQAEALHLALTMPQPERQARLLAARAVVESYDARTWLVNQVHDVRSRRALVVPLARESSV